MNVHSTKPQRSQANPQINYTLYRDQLRSDFNGACGYCDDNDYNLDSICFHIDHFAPKSKFPHLELTYSNLVYACRFCNIRKSYHWIGNDPAIHNDGQKGFLDPCGTDFDVHIERDANGCILGKTDLGRYIVRRLSLNLLRHQLLWKARRTRVLRDEVNKLLEHYKLNNLSVNPEYVRLLECFRDLTQRIEQYEFSARVR